MAFTNFLMDGYHVYKDASLLSIMDLETLGLVADANRYINDDTFDKDIYTSKLSLLQESRVNQLREHIEKRYLVGWTAELVECGLWDGVDDNSAVWHNDNLGKVDCSFLCYLCDTDSTLGGALEVKTPIGQTIHYPKAGDVVWLNQNTTVFHKATPSSKKRIVVGFDYKIKELGGS